MITNKKREEELKIQRQLIREEYVEPYFQRESMSKHMIRINRKQRKITKGKEMTL